MSFSSASGTPPPAVPATNERALAKARTLDADEVFVDLEDAVSADAKSEAREGAARALAGGDWRAQTLSLRINGVATTWWRDDLEVVVPGAACRLDSVVLPKVESGGDVETVAGVLAELEAELELKRPISLQAQIESPKGLIEVERIAGSSARLETLVFGPGDYAASLGIGQRFIREIAGTRRPVAPCAVADRRGGSCLRLQPIDGPTPRSQTRTVCEVGPARSHAGFQGKWVIHPDQIEIVNEVFSPTEEELAHAVRVLDALATADDGGQGVGVVGGAMSTKRRASSRKGRPASPGRSKGCGMKPLQDVRVLSLEQFGAGPWGTMQLADLGAEVIKIEDPTVRGDVGRAVPPFQADGSSLFFESFNRNKRSLALDLRKPEARPVLEDLVRGSDALFSNLRATSRRSSVCGMTT